MSFLVPSFDLLVTIWMSAAIVMAGLWLFQYFHGNAVVADLGFCLLFIVTSIIYAIVLQGDTVRKVMLGGMGAVYASRLGWHLFVHRICGKTEDARYQALRKKMGEWAQVGFVLYFQGQALALVLFSLPILVLMVNPSPPFGGWESIGIMIWLVAVIGEGVADYQLNTFRENTRNKGKTCRQGLWGYSRHPNYFFEGLIWCSYVVMAIGVPHGWLTLIGPVVMIGALLKVSGIPFTETQALATRGEDYREYQRTTNAFIPWFPKKGL
ncbi:MAG: DUF1295 domain-containing protein [Nitrospirales bacterium]